MIMDLTYMKTEYVSELTIHIRNQNQSPLLKSVRKESFLEHVTKKGKSPKSFRAHQQVITQINRT